MSIDVQKKWFLFFQSRQISCTAIHSSPDLKPSPVVNSDYNSDQGDEGADVYDDFRLVRMMRFFVLLSVGVEN